MFRDLFPGSTLEKLTFEREAEGERGQRMGSTERLLIITGYHKRCLGGIHGVCSVLIAG